MTIDHVLDDGQTKPCAFGAHFPSFLDTVKPLREPWNMVGLNPFSIIHDRKHDTLSLIHI